MIKLELPMAPPSVNTIWINKPKGRFKSVKGREFDKRAKQEIAIQYLGKPLRGKLKVKIKLFFKDNRKRDIDNYNKGVLDAMTGFIYEDDSQIDELFLVKKINCGFDKVEIFIDEISEEKMTLF
ncbi:RusA family crossover junction endodeoxyribonuclease [Leptotrichia sp. OH3620_COT-345]|uniref:RusA family crossover junction endodeoxyribonuclease n=1 Tax=Leptotrichia sp. OH3620_COT-345 TaxID=2491048 RepID=UPI0013154C5E|nr:RusA family crossover junction endodeoxyribonuclease [Leptotrichia sp. OH3620_COT-345]